jgi:hypothetical protein
MGLAKSLFIYGIIENSPGVALVSRRAICYSAGETLAPNTMIFEIIVGTST